jgi:Raf kinase inhibitor-like YbhB/YbcL family protein
MLRGMRAGLGKTMIHDPALTGVPASIVVASSSFASGGSIPHQHSADGERLSPALTWHGVPEDAESLALLIEDADSPTLSPFVHLVAWALPGCDGELAAGACNAKAGAPADGAAEFRLGRNGLFGLGYTPPDPPPGHGPHRYIFQIFALDRSLSFRSTPSRGSLARELRRSAIAKGALEGLYERA